MDRYFITRELYDELIEKGFGRKDYSKLTKKVITDKNGHQRTVYKKNGEEPEKERTKKVEEPAAEKKAAPKMDEEKRQKYVDHYNDMIKKVQAGGDKNALFVAGQGMMDKKTALNYLNGKLDKLNAMGTSKPETKDPEAKNNQAEDTHDKKYGKATLWEDQMKQAIASGDKDKMQDVIGQISSEFDSMYEDADDMDEDTDGFIQHEFDKVNKMYDKALKTTSSKKAEPEETKTTGKEEKQLTPTYGRKQIPADQFKAAEYKEKYDDDRIDTTNAGLEEALRQVMELPIIKKHSEFEMRLRYDLQRAEKEPETVTKFRKSGEGVTAVYTPERAKIHEDIINELLSDEMVKAATPEKGQKPTFQILGGRGGSGKSTFNKKKSDAGVYDPDKVIVIDPDALKEMIANASGEKWEGWKAKAYHEESSDLSKMLMKRALAQGLNIVMDITMSNADKQIDELKLAKALGYKTGAYYMHVPKQESYKRAMKRYLQNPDDDKIEDYSGRLVPPEVLLSMTGNEANFDKIKEFADDWSFYDNFIPFEKDPNTKKNKYKAEKIAQKGE